MTYSLLLRDDETGEAVAVIEGDPVDNFQMGLRDLGSGEETVVITFEENDTSGRPVPHLSIVPVEGGTTDG